MERPTAMSDANYYRASAGPGAARPPLRGERRCDVCVVGAGFTGLSAALHLAEAGLDVVVLEAGRVGHGASGRNGGQICTAFAKGMDVLESRLGAEDARTAWRVAADGVDLIARRVQRHAIDCDLVWGYLHVGSKDRHAREMAETVEEFARYGYHGAAVLGRADTRARLASERFVCALYEPRAGHLHPLKYAQGLARALEAEGGTIHEESPVVAVETETARPRARAVDGTVRADHLILAGNAYLGRLVPYLANRVMPVGSYVVATEPLGADRAGQLIPGNEAVCTWDFIPEYFRLTADRRMLYGGRATYSGIEPRDLAGYMRPRLARSFPSLKAVRLDHAWGGHIGITVERLPHLGRLGPASWFAQGFSGHGVALSGIYGALIAEALTDRPERFEVMARLTPTVFPGGRLRAPLLALGMLYYRLRDALG